MADSVSTLSLAVDSTGVGSAEQALNKMADAGKGAADSATQLEAAVKKVSDTSNQASASAATTAASYGRLAQSQNAYLAGLQREVDVFGKSRSEIAARDAAVMKLSASEQTAARALGSQIDALEREEAASKSLAASQDAAAKAVDSTIQKLQLQASVVGKTATEQTLATLAAKGATAAQLEAAGAALLTIDGAKKSASAVGEFSLASAGARRELIVLGHELSQGNFTKFAGSFGVLAERTNATALVFSVTGVAVLGTVAALTAFAVAAALGAAESERLKEALILSGNAAGATFTQLQGAAKGISAIVGTQGAAADALAQIAGSGAVASENLQKFGLVAVEMSRTTGQSVEETVKQFVELGRSPVDASVKLNQSLHYLTSSTFDQIKALEDVGKTTEAAALAQNAYADAMLNRTAEIQGNLGLIQIAWHGIADAAKGAWDAMLNIGRTASIGEQLQAVNEKIAAAQAKLSGPNDRSGFNTDRQQAARSQLPEEFELQASLTRRALLEDNIATSAKAAAESTEKHVKFVQDGVKYLTQEQQKQQEIAKAQNSGESADAIKTRIDAINASYAKAPATARNTDRSTLNEQLGQFTNDLNQKLDVYKSAQSLFDAQRSAGQKSDAQFFEQERINLELYEAANLKEIEAALAARKVAVFTGPSAENNSNANQQAINKLEEERLKVMNDTESASQRLDVQQTSAEQRRLAAYQANEQAAQRALDQTQKQYDLDLQVARLGSATAAQIAGRAQIENKYANDLQAENDKKSNLQTAGSFNADAQKDYDKQIALIEAFKTKSLASYDDYYAQRKAQDADYTVGVDKATNQYIENAQNVAKLAENAYTNAFSNIEDALVAFATTGKINFKSLADSIIADVVRMEVKAAESKLLQAAQGNAGGIGSSYSGGVIGLLGSLAGLFTGGSYSANNGIGYASAAGISGGRAGGGGVDSGKTYLVGEKGPELLRMGSQAGIVIPNSAISSRQNITIVNQTTGRIDNLVDMQISPTERALIVQESVQTVASQHYDPNSRISQAMKKNYKAERAR